MPTGQEVWENYRDEIAGRLEKAKDLKGRDIGGALMESVLSYDVFLDGIEQACDAYQPPEDQDQIKEFAEKQFALLEKAEEFMIRLAAACKREREPISRGVPSYGYGHFDDERGR